MRKALIQFLVASLVAALSVVGVTAAVQPAAATGGFQSTMGLEFWVNFDNNLSNTRTPTIYLSGAQNANVTITWPDLTTQQVTVTAGAVTTVNAVAKIATASKYTTQVDGISQTAVKIVSDKPISVYVSNQVYASSDASQAYPTEYQGYEYRPLIAGTTSLDKRFSVIANESGTTTVTITPKVTIGARAAGTPYNVTLNQGDVYSIRVTGSDDFSGTRITSDKKITVSSTNGCANLTGGACDHMTEYIPPVPTWGKSFVFPASINSSSSQKDMYRVMASQDNTTVIVDGVSTVLALAGDYVAGQIPAINQNMVITADKPVLTMQFVQAGTYNDGTNNVSGDPAMVLVTPVVQYLNDMVITTPATGFTVNTVSLVVPTSDVGVAAIDGTPIPANDYSSALTVGSATYKVVRKFITLGTHTISSTNGVGVFVYGFNNFDSYTYAGAGGMVDLVQNPGGVAQVGYVAAAQVGNSNPPAQAPASVVAPAAPIYFNLAVPASTSGTLRLNGVNLTGVSTLKIGSVVVEIVSTNMYYTEIKWPALSAGTYSIHTTGTNSTGAWMGSQLNALTVQAAATESSSTKSATLAVPNFSGGSAVLTSAMKSKIAATIAQYPTLKSASCVGSTSGPTVLPVDAALAKRRAAAVCRYIGSLVPTVSTSIFGKTTVLGAVARNVEVTLKF